MVTEAYFIIGGAFWLVGMFCAWALIRGAEKLRRQREAVAIPVRRPGSFMDVAYGQHFGGQELSAAA